MSRYFGGASISVSNDVFEVLLQQDGEKSLEQLLCEANVEVFETDKPLTELMELWEKRAIVLLPKR